MKYEEFAQRVEAIRTRLYKTALLYLNDEHLALDAVGEAIYKALKNVRKLRDPAFFNTWITRIVINECYNELRRQMHLSNSEITEERAEAFDALPLKEAVQHLPKELRDLVILRYFSGFTLAESAQILSIPQGTAATRQRKALSLLRLELSEEVSE